MDNEQPAGGRAASIEGDVATNSQDLKQSDLKTANRRLREALDECRTLLERTERMLKSEQDNKPGE